MTGATTLASTLVEAARAGNIALLRAEISKAADIGRPLWEKMASAAIEGAQIEVLEFMLSERSTKSTAAVLARHAIDHDCPSALEVIDAHDALSKASMLSIAIDRGKRQSIAWLLPRTPMDAFAKGEMVANAIGFDAEGPSRSSILQMLRDSSDFAPFSECLFVPSPLRAAAQAGNIALLSEWLPLSTQAVIDDALPLAAFSNAPIDALKVLARAATPGCNVAAAAKVARTPQHLESLKMLLDAGHKFSAIQPLVASVPSATSPDNIRFFWGLVPPSAQKSAFSKALTAAVQYHNPEAADWLFDLAGDMKGLSAALMPALRVAIKNGHQDFLDRLLPHCKIGRPALCDAARHPGPDMLVVKRLMAKSSDQTLEEALPFMLASAPASLRPLLAAEIDLAILARSGENKSSPSPKSNL